MFVTPSCWTSSQSFQAQSQNWLPFQNHIASNDSFTPRFSGNIPPVKGEAVPDVVTAMDSFLDSWKTAVPKYAERLLPRDSRIHPHCADLQLKEVYWFVGDDPMKGYYLALPKTKNRNPQSRFVIVEDVLPGDAQRAPKVLRLEIERGEKKGDTQAYFVEGKNRLLITDYQRQSYEERLTALYDQIKKLAI